MLQHDATAAWTQSTPPLPEWGAYSAQPPAGRAHQPMSLEYIQQHHLRRPSPQQSPDVDTAISNLQAHHVRSLQAGPSQMQVDNSAYGLPSSSSSSALGISMDASMYDAYSQPYTSTSQGQYDPFAVPVPQAHDTRVDQQPSRAGFSSLAHLPREFLPTSVQLPHSQSFPSLHDLPSQSASAFSSSQMNAPQVEISQPQPRLSSLSIPALSHPDQQQISPVEPKQYPPSAYSNFLGSQRSRDRSATMSSTTSSVQLDSPMYEWNGSDGGGTSDYSLPDGSPDPNSFQGNPGFDFSLSLNNYESSEFHRSHSLPQLQGLQGPTLSQFVRNQDATYGTGMGHMPLPSILPTPPTSKGPSPASQYARAPSDVPISIDLSTPRYESEMSFPVLPGQSPPITDVPAVAETAEASLPLNGQGEPDMQAVVQPYVEEFVKSSNRLALGERSIFVLSPKVGQKSYGNEKRFICPPPAVMLLGNSWLRPISDASTRRSSPPSRINGTRPSYDQPKVQICMSTQSPDSMPESSLDWSLPTGHSFDPDASPNAARQVSIGRAMGKALYITDAEEKKKKIEAIIRLTEAGSNQILGSFYSKTIKVISKPSKKRQTSKANFELCVNHGSTIALFHRLRSQTVSTKYLCVSGAAATLRGSDGQPIPGAATSEPAQPAFVARTSIWDSFIIYIVDVNALAEGGSTIRHPTMPDYPPPPPAAIHSPGGQHPIYYNQTVVLQCLLSGVVSPILIIRRVDNEAIAVGGAQVLEPNGEFKPSQTTTHDQWVPAGEICGDPVSQLHRVAFEVYDPKKAVPGPTELGTPGSYLSCSADKVNTFNPVAREWNKPASAVKKSTSPDMGERRDSSSSIAEEDSSSNPTSPLIGIRPGTPAGSVDLSGDGGKVKRKRGSISAELHGKATGAARKRANSKSSAASKESGTGKRARKTPEPAEAVADNGQTWGCDVTDACVWTLVGIDYVRHNFYVPPILFSASHTSRIPRFPAMPITPFPGIVKYLPPDRASELPKHHQSAFSQTPSAQNGVVAATAVGTTKPPDPSMLTIYGQNFSKTEPLWIFFGSEASSHVDMRCTEVLQCMPPAKVEDDGPHVRRPMMIVRRDGIVFPSNVMYP